MNYSYKESINGFDFEKMNTGVQDFCEQSEVSPKKLYAVQLIIEELVTNIIKYGKRDNSSETIEINIEILEESIQLMVTDNSMSFNPLTLNDPDINLTADERSMGGLGLFLIRKMAKSLIYENKNGYNVVKAEL